MKITVDKIKRLGITIPTNGKYEDLIKLNYDEKKVKIKNIMAPLILHSMLETIGSGLHNMLVSVLPSWF
jgi:hypothetical protein